MNGNPSNHQAVLDLVCYGYSNKVIATKLGLSIKTVEKHRQSWLTKAHCHATIPLLRWAITEGHVSLFDWLEHQEIL